MKDTFKTFPDCKDCKIFKKTKTHPNRALMCETARATGACPKDLWKKRIENELQERKAKADKEMKGSDWIQIKELLSEGRKTYLTTLLTQSNLTR